MGLGMRSLTTVAKAAGDDGFDAERCESFRVDMGRCGAVMTTTALRRYTKASTSARCAELPFAFFADAATKKTCALRLDAAS